MLTVSVRVPRPARGVPPAHVVCTARPQLDSSSKNTDKSVVTTMPQLSSQALLGATVSLAGARLYALLANSHVHLWELHLKRPPTFAVRGRREGRRAGGVSSACARYSWVRGAL